MKPIHEQKEATRFLEGVFYPTGHMVVGLEDQQAAEKAHEALMRAGVPEEHVTLIDAASMEREAGDSLSQVSLLSVGASIPAREMQQDLAREGCAFLLIFAPEEQDHERIAQLLRGHPVRYAVKYRALIIENLMNSIRSSSGDTAPARVP